MSEYISIKEFSELADVSSQSIYKRIKKLDNPIQAFLKRKNNQLTIDKEALQVLYGIKVEETTTEPSLKVEQPSQEKQKNNRYNQDKQQKTENLDPSSKIIEILKQQIDSQRKDIEEKNKQIADLNNRLAESQKMLDQEQKLNAMSSQRILQLEEGQSKGLFGFFKRLTSK